MTTEHGRSNFLGRIGTDAADGIVTEVAKIEGATRYGLLADGTLEPAPRGPSSSSHSRAMFSLYDPADVDPSANLAGQRLTWTDPTNAANRVHGGSQTASRELIYWNSKYRDRYMGIGVESLSGDVTGIFLTDAKSIYVHEYTVDTFNIFSGLRFQRVSGTASRTRSGQIIPYKVWLAQLPATLANWAGAPQAGAPTTVMLIRQEPSPFLRYGMIKQDNNLFGVDDFERSWTQASPSSTVRLSGVSGKRWWIGFGVPIEEMPAVLISDGRTNHSPLFERQPETVVVGGMQYGVMRSRAKAHPNFPSTWVVEGMMP